MCSQRSTRISLPADCGSLSDPTGIHICDKISEPYKQGRYQPKAPKKQTNIGPAKNLLLKAEWYLDKFITATVRNVKCTDKESGFVDLFDVPL